MQQNWVDITHCNFKCPNNTRCIRPLELIEPIECLHNSIPIEKFGTLLREGNNNNKNNNNNFISIFTLPEVIMIGLLVHTQLSPQPITLIYHFSVVQHSSNTFSDNLLP